MKAKKCCDTCEFKFYGDDGICAGHGTIENSTKDTYGMKIKETKELFPNGCDNWGISFEAFCKEKNL